MPKKLIILEHTNGHVEEMQDHTDWFVEQFGETGAVGYYDTIVNRAITLAGGIKKIKRLARWNGNLITQDFVLYGYNMLTLKREVKHIGPDKLAEVICEFVKEFIGFKPSDDLCELFGKAVYGEMVET